MLRGYFCICVGVRLELDWSIAKVSRFLTGDGFILVRGANGDGIGKSQKSLMKQHSNNAGRIHDEVGYERLVIS